MKIVLGFFLFLIFLCFYRVTMCCCVKVSLGEKLKKLGAYYTTRFASRTVVLFTGKFMVCQPYHQSNGATRMCRKKVHGRVHGSS